MATKSTVLVVAVLLVVAGVPASGHEGENAPPQADAGLDQQVSLGAVVFLDGGGSIDTDGRIVEYEWRIETPDGKTITPRNASAPMTRFVPSQTGRYEVTLRVTDDDGATRSDTMYVDVVTGGPADGGSENRSGNGSAPGGGGSGNDGSESGDGSAGDGSDQVSNVPPDVSVTGPKVLEPGSTATYYVSATDTDGTIVARQFGGVVSGSGESVTHQFGEPGTYWVTATVTDDDGATATARKRVQVVEPEDEEVVVDLEGPETVPQGSYATFFAHVANRDNGMVFYWSPPGDDPGVAGSSMRRRFMQPVGTTVNVTVTVRDGAGNVGTASKEVLITDRKTDKRQISPEKPRIGSLHTEKLSPSDEGKESTVSYTTYRIYTSVWDENGDSVWVSWNFEDGTVKSKRVENASEETIVSVTKTFIKDNSNSHERTAEEETSVLVTAKDQSGKTASNEFTIHVLRGYRHGDIDVKVQKQKIKTGSNVVVYFNTLGDSIINFGDGNQIRVDEDIDSISHTYKSEGNYTIVVMGMDGNHVQNRGSITIRAEDQTYSEYHYQQIVETVESVVNRSKPSSKDWEKEDRVRKVKESTGTKQKVLRATERVRSIMEEDGWTRVDQRVRNSTSTKYEVSEQPPGPEWQLSKSNVEQTSRITGWRRHELKRPDRYQTPDNWRYVKTIYRSSTKTIRSSNQPGYGWERGQRVGRTPSGYRVEVFDDRGHAGWDYLSRFCADEFDTMGGSICFDYDYRYGKQTYDYVYRWKKTVTTTIGVYEEPIIQKVWLDRYEKEVVDTKTYDVWEKHTHEYYDVYRWTIREIRTVNNSSLTKPSENIYVEGTLTNHEHECKSEKGENHQRAC